MNHGSVLIRSESQSLEVKGHVHFSNVVELQSQGVSLIGRALIKTVTVDLKNLVNCDSSGLALLVGWVREAKKQNKNIQLINLPPFLKDILKLFGLDSVLPILWEN